MKKIKLSPAEKKIEKALIEGEYQAADPAELRDIADAITRRKKDSVLNIRVNHHDLESLKNKASHLGVPYQSLISEIIHHFAV